MSLIVDASVAIKWFSDEQGSLQAELILDSSEQLVAPNFILAENASGLVKKLRLNLLSLSQTMTAIETAESFFDRLVPTHELIPQASRLAFELAHPVYDCFYLARLAGDRAAGHR